MHTRICGRWLATLVVTLLTGTTVASCGSSNGSTFTPGQLDGSSGDATAMADSGYGTFGDDGGGGPTPCVPKTCPQLGYTCGMNGDGCGGTLDCGACPTGQTCGAGGYSLCGSGGGPTPDGGSGDDGGQTNNCTPETCQSLNINCGYAGDGCGGVLTCGSCTNPQFCGGGGYNKCGGNNGISPDERRHHFALRRRAPCWDAIHTVASPPTAAGRRAHLRLVQ